MPGDWLCVCVNVWRVGLGGVKVLSHALFYLSVTVQREVKLEVCMVKPIHIAVNKNTQRTQNYTPSPFIK